MSLCFWLGSIGPSLALELRVAVEKKMLANSPSAVLPQPGFVAAQETSLVMLVR